MITEIEKTFFDTFGIKPIEAIFCGYDGACPFDYPCDECPYFLNNKGSYPQISDRILLKLICIANEAYIDLEGTDIETMKNSLLENFIFFRRDVYDQVRTLFEEG